MKTETIQWGWLNPEGKPQVDTFETAEDAIDEMCKRLGREMTCEDIAESGFRLCRVKVSVEPVQVMSNPWTPMDL